MAHQNHPNTGPAGALSRGPIPKPDFETAFTLRACLLPIFERSRTWAGLLTRLRRKGYGLAFRDGRLVLTDIATRKRVCSDRFLGQPIADLVRRLGRPTIRPLPGNRADGEFYDPAAPR